MPNQVLHKLTDPLERITIYDHKYCPFPHYETINLFLSKTLVSKCTLGYIGFKTGKPKSYFLARKIKSRRMSNIPMLETHFFPPINDHTIY